jgi:hypothetical protein
MTRQDLQSKGFLGQIGATQAPSVAYETRQKSSSSVLSQSVALGINAVQQSLAGAVRSAANTGNGQIFPVASTTSPQDLQRIQNTNRSGATVRR